MDKMKIIPTYSSKLYRAFSLLFPFLMLIFGFYMANNINKHPRATSPQPIPTTKITQKLSTSTEKGIRFISPYGFTFLYPKAHYVVQSLPDNINIKYWDSQEATDIILTEVKIESLAKIRSNKNVEFNIIAPNRILIYCSADGLQGGTNCEQTTKVVPFTTKEGFEALKIYLKLDTHGQVLKELSDKTEVGPAYAINFENEYLIIFHNIPNQIYSTDSARMVKDEEAIEGIINSLKKIDLSPTDSI